MVKLTFLTMFILLLVECSVGLYLRYTTVPVITGLGQPQHMVSCPNGFVYFSDYGSIFRMDPKTYQLTTVAGTGNGQTGDVDGPYGTNRISIANGFACDSNNVIYFADTNNNKIKKLENGVITTIGGNGQQGNSFVPMGAISSSLYFPNSVFLLNGEVYFSDTINCRIKKITKDGMMYGVLGTNKCGSVYMPDGTLASNFVPLNLYMSGINTKGEIFFEENANIRKIEAGTNRIVTVAGNSDYNSDKRTDVLATQAPINTQYQIIVDPVTNDLIFGDSWSIIIRRIDNKLGLIHTIAGQNDIKDYGANNQTIYNTFGITYNNATKTIFYTGEGSIHKLVPYCPPEYPYDPITDSCVNTCNGAPSNTSDACSFNGECTLDGVCVCGIGARGVNCNITTCNAIDFDQPSVCYGNGQCVGPEKCSCKAGYTGKYCQFAICDGLTDDSGACNSHGSCVSPNVCQCKAAYVGYRCDVIRCGTKFSNDSDVCNYRGNCYVFDADYPGTCSCNDKWGGHNCEQKTCFGTPMYSADVCYGFGNCTDFDICNCSKGYSGEDCGTYKCFGISSTDYTNVCSGRGSCDALDKCSCNDGYSGLKCEIFYCNGILSNASNACTNEANGECGVAGHCYCSGSDTCSCKPGYYDTGCVSYECAGIMFNNETVCMGRGNCSTPDMCTGCTGGYGGNNCELAKCYGILNTSASVCSGHGSCLTPDDCQCKQNYYGTYCENFECFGIVKSNYSYVCSSRGNCVDYNTCTCNKGYEGPDCSVKTPSNCNGVLSNNPNVCSKHGICNDDNVCECQENFAGVNCGFELVTQSLAPLNPKYDFIVGSSVVINSPYVSIAYLWKEDTGAIILSGPSVTQPNLVIKANTILTEGISLNFTVTVTITEAGSKVSVLKKTVTTRVNKLPVIDEFKLYDNSTGLQTTSGVGFQTVFKVTSLGSDPDSDPISYTVGYLSGISNNIVASRSSETTFYFKLPFTSAGYVTLYLSVLDSNLGERVQYINVTLSDPAAKLADDAKIEFAKEILSTPNVTVADVSSSAYYLTTVNTSTSSAASDLRTKIVDVIATDIYKKDKDSALDIVTVVVSEPKLVSYTSQISVLTLMNDSSISSSQADKVLTVTSTLLSVSNDSTSSNLIKSIISVAAQSKAAALTVGSQATTISSNLNSTVVKNTIASLAASLDTSIGVSGIKLPSTSLSQVLSNSGFNVTDPIVLSMNVASKSLYAYENWNTTSPFFIFKILSGVDTSKTLSVSGLVNPIEFEMNVDSVSSNFTSKCVYVNEQTKSLSSDGVETVVISTTRVKCRVYHLTDFTTIPVRKIDVVAAASSGNSIKPKVSASPKTGTSKGTVISSAHRMFTTSFIVVILTFLATLL